MDTAVNPSYILKLWDFASLLMYRAEATDGPEKELLLEQADDMLENIAQYLGKKPIDAEDLEKLLGSPS